VFRISETAQVVEDVCARKEIRADFSGVELIDCAPDFG
jgi:hypothetical protein